MIVKGLFELIYTFLNIVLTPFQIIPNVPNTVTQFMGYFFDLIFAPINLFCFFVPANIVRALIPALLVVLNMEHIWNGIIWVLKKLPFVGIE